jgi:hypothetical protein
LTGVRGRAKPLSPASSVRRVEVGNIRRIQLPSADELVGPVEGIPDVIGTRWVCLGSALVFAGFAIWLPIACADRIEANLDVGTLLLITLASVGCVVVAIFLCRAARNAGGCFSVTNTHLAFGFGRSCLQPGAEGNTRIPWENLTTDPSSGFDVSLDSPSRYNILAPSLIIWCRTESDHPQKRFIPLALTGDRLRCLRFRNRRTVQLAMLQMLARRGLRFDPWVFASASIDPATWQPRPGPTLMLWFAALAVIGAMFGWTWSVADSWSPESMVVGDVLFFAVGLWIFKRLFDAAYRDLDHPIVFCPENH